MILGMSTEVFTVVHVIISLLALVTGTIVVFGLLGGRPLAVWTHLFLITTALTSITGFFFHSTSFGPPHLFGVITLVVLILAVPARYVYHLRGSWRWIYVAGAILVLYLNVFVAVVQAFQKLAFLNPLAPTQSEPPFVVAQGVLLILSVLAVWQAIRRFHPAGVPVSR